MKRDDVLSKMFEAEFCEPKKGGQGTRTSRIIASGLRANRKTALCFAAGISESLSTISGQTTWQRISRFAFRDAKSIKLSIQWPSPQNNSI
jgi:hypothetical protein